MRPWGSWAPYTAPLGTSMQNDCKVATTLAYYHSKRGDDSLPAYYRYYDDGTETPTVNYMSALHFVYVENIRNNAEDYNLNAAGFQLFHHDFTHFDPEDEQAITDSYYPQVIEVVKEITGSSKAVVFEHAVRRHRTDSSSAKHPQPAKRFVHVDQTPLAAFSRVSKHLPEAELVLKQRFQIVNLWRPINYPALDWPLALCDYRSVDTGKDLVAVDLLYPDRKGQIFTLKYNPNHQWKYFRGMEPSDFVIFKCFDSIQDGSTTTLVPHAAFEDPTAPSNSPLRESIEVRLILFFET